MPLSKLVFKPGINRDQTNYASEGGWYEMDKVRFRSGFPEKIGGWTVNTSSPYSGVARAVYPWVATDGSTPIAIGTNEKIYVTVGGNLINVTPIQTILETPSTDNSISTVDGSAVVTATFTTAHNGIEGDWVYISGVVGPVGGIPEDELNGEFKIFNVTSTSFSYNVTTPATATVAAGGGTTIVVDMQLNIGNVITTTGYGWGAGGWGRGTWGSGTNTPIYIPARLMYFENFNNDLLFNIQGGDIYYWTFNTVSGLPAVKLSDIPGSIAVPQEVTQIHVTPQGFILALGCTVYDPNAAAPNYTGPYDALMIRWANVDANVGPDPLNWQPLLTNSSGYLRIQTGSKIITCMSTRQETLVWTDTSLNSLQYLGTAEVFGIQQMSAHSTIIGPNVVVGANNITYWMGTDKFYTYSGRVDTLPCTLRQYIFQDINRTQGSIFFAGSNVQFNEIIWFYCSANSNEIDRYVIYNYAENLWYYGQLHRTTWMDAGTIEFPIATADGWLYYHENGTDDGQPYGQPPLPITAYIQSADIDLADGDKFMLTRRVIPDVNFRGSETANPVTGEPIVPKVDITVGVRNFPGAASVDTNASDQTTNRDIVTTTATIDQYTNQVFVRARGRQMNFKISSNTVGTQWQLGMPRVDARTDGSRS